MPSTSNRPFNRPPNEWTLSLRLTIGAVALAGAFGLFLWRAPSPKDTAATYNVTIENMKFSPNALKIQIGDQITFKNQDLFPHTVTKAGVLDSGMIKAGESWTYTAEKEGSIHYACSYHPVMEGTIEVVKR